MSIAVLNQVYDEVRRLSVAGSVVARGDFRLKKLVAPLEQAGAKAPVFAKVADAVKGVTDGPEAASAPALLELASLVSAVLYTQGETGLAGELAPIETVDLGAGVSQLSARVLKPLLEALTTTGSGREEIVRDAFERGAFRDLRLVRHAVRAIDDVYAPIADFVAAKVLPLYGKAIVPELRATLDLKGNRGHVHRLELLHRLDPEGSRELVKRALDEGAKEVKVAAIACLGPGDLSYLLEQANSRTQDVRVAAYLALGKVDDDAARAALHKAIVGKDLDIAHPALRSATDPKLVAMVLAEAAARLKAMGEAAGKADKKGVSEAAVRVGNLLMAVEGRTDDATSEFVLKLFAERSALAKIKGETHGGSDVVDRVMGLMRDGSTAMQVTLASAHEKLTNEQLTLAALAARRGMAPEQVYDIFSTYWTGGPTKSTTNRRRDAILEAFGANRGRYAWYYQQPGSVDRPLDVRWVNLAVKENLVGLAHVAGRPGHAGLEKFLGDRLDRLLAQNNDPEDLAAVVAAMVRFQHPDAADAVLRMAARTNARGHHNFYWLCRMIPDLPKSAIPALEAFAPQLKDSYNSDQWLSYVQQLRDRPDPTPSAS